MTITLRERVTRKRLDDKEAIRTRAEMCIELYLEGKSYAEIGRHPKVDRSRQRVKQIIDEYLQLSK